jgi:hypothetical protein
MPTPKPPMRPFLFVWGGGIFLLLLLVGVTNLLPDSKTKALRTAPGLDLVFPDGVLLDRGGSTSLFGSGASDVRAYGTSVPVERIVAFYDAALPPLGYTKVPPTPDPHFHADILAQYVNGPFAYRLFLVLPPTRVNGYTYTTEFARYLQTKISD